MPQKKALLPSPNVCFFYEKVPKNAVLIDNVEEWCEVDSGDGLAVEWWSGPGTAA